MPRSRPFRWLRIHRSHEGERASLSESDYATAITVVHQQLLAPMIIRVHGPDDPGPPSQMLVTDRPLARRVTDQRLAYEALAGTAPRAVPVPAHCEPLPGLMKVAVVADPGVHPTLRRAACRREDTAAPG